MILDFAKLGGEAEQPIMRLRTLAGKELGPVQMAYGVSVKLNYAELSTMEFDVPAWSDGVKNPCYDKLTGYKVVYTDRYGIYILSRPTTEGDGASETKHVTGYSLEQLFEKKRLYLEEGTYNFWNPASPDDTILARILELDPTWGIGYVSPELVGRYRTFDEYDNDPLSFCYGDGAEKYHCAIVFDVYRRTINAYELSDQADAVPVYLSYDNLVESVKVEELTDDMVTKLHVYGADDLNIRDVNPMGTDYLIDLGYFLDNGDLDIYPENSTALLSDKVRKWKAEIKAQQSYYTGLVSARAAKSGQKLAEEVALTEKKGALETLTAQQSVTIQALAMETTEDGKRAQQVKLDEINGKIDAKKAEISAQEAGIKAIQADMDGYAERIKAVTAALSVTGYFTQEERNILNHFMVEGDVTEETFVSTDVDTSISGASSEIAGAVELSGSSLYRVKADDKNLISASGGMIAIPDSGISGEVTRASLEIGSDDQFVMSVYLGATAWNDKKFPSGMLTLYGGLSGLTSDIHKVTEDDVTEYRGTQLQFNGDGAHVFFTVNVSEYQKYAVAQELYDYGESILAEKAWPVYEFSLDSANFLYQKEFAPFQNVLTMGKAVYLRIDKEKVVRPRIVGVELSFDDVSKFTLTFSNQFQTKNGVDSWKDEIESVSSSSRSFDANKYIYNKMASQSTQVSNFMKGQLDAAVNTILGAANQTVLINGAGIQIGGDGKYQMRLVDNMIAMTDDGWKTAKLAIGRFADPETGEQWGVNAEVVAGKLIVGNNLVLENATDDGVMQFKVDATGAWLNNAVFVLQKDNGGRMLLDPRYGIISGNGDIFSTSGTTVYPAFVDEDGSLVLDDENMPKNSSFYLDIRDGNAYFRGVLAAKAGKIGGFDIAADFLHTGSGANYVAMNGSGANDNSAYAFWAGAESPENARWWVKKDGTMYAKDGTFSGTLTASKLSGSLSALDDDSWLEGCGIKVGKNSAATKGYNFYVDTKGNAYLQGNLTLKDGAISWGNLNKTVTDQIDTANKTAETANTNAQSASRLANSALETAIKIANGDYKGTFIDKTKIISPEIYTNYFEITQPDKNEGFPAFALLGYFGGSLYEWLNISYKKSIGPYVYFNSPAGAYAYWQFEKTTFDSLSGITEFIGKVDFDKAEVTGLYAQFA